MAASIWLSGMRARKALGRAAAAAGAAVGVPVAWEIAPFARAHAVSFIVAGALTLGSYALIAKALTRRELPIALALVFGVGAGLGATLFAGVAPIAPFLATLDGEVHPLFVMFMAATRAAIAGLAAGLVLTGVAALFRKIAKSLERTVNEGSRAAQDGWMVALLLFVLAGLYVVFRHDSEWSWMNGTTDPLLYVFMGVATLGAIGSATSAALAQLELHGRAQWLLEIVAQREQRFRIASTGDLPLDLCLPAINAPADECNAVLLEEEGEVDQPYRTAPRAIALVRTNAPS